MNMLILATALASVLPSVSLSAVAQASRLCSSASIVPVLAVSQRTNVTSAQLSQSPSLTGSVLPQPRRGDKFSAHGVSRGIPSHHPPSPVGATPSHLISPTSPSKKPWAVISQHTDSPSAQQATLSGLTSSCPGSVLPQPRRGDKFLAHGVSRGIPQRTTPSSTPSTSAPDPSQATQHIHAGPITVSLTADHTEIRAADSLTLTLTVTAPTGFAIDFPVLTDTLGDFSIVSTHDDPPSTSHADAPLTTTRTRRYILEPFLPGDYTIPILDLPWRHVLVHDSDPHAQGVAHTQPLTIHVLSLLPTSTSTTTPPDPASLDPGTIRGRYTPPAITLSWWDRWGLTAAIAASLGATSLTLVGVWAARRRRTSLSAHERAISTVRALRASPLSSADTARLCEELSHALRLSLTDRLGPCAQTMTPAEILAQSPQKHLAHPKTAGIVSSGGIVFDEPVFGGTGLQTGAWAKDITAGPVLNDSAQQTPPAHSATQPLRHFATLLSQLDTIRFSGQQLPTDQLLPLIDAALTRLNTEKGFKGDRA